MEEVGSIPPRYHDLLWLFEMQEADELPPIGLQTYWPDPRGKASSR